ncbi:sn-glycerol-3-phosphate ABC transporter substrate-binding protein UgpB [Roseomonas sp. NAR14]|uniref:sn-glycerol-3-phosphate-binding periplasmic protein UgpB n=1 Tax=Roseomonas acroporae TaxID=2937791 RepID=A0A9X1YAH7_9PROT|nr:sn-glycerol-3-phosphate ABC transporter substrate-binding protein UgpB [Roseomonas acroporae]MCK8785375.1 sn-glycerol-3-phosphate ABC transporter substrate-binding protein UgpB [Roseomonas acroporae]
MPRRPANALPLARRAVLAAAPALLATPSIGRAQAAPVELHFWHGLPQPLGGLLEAMVAAYNDSQRGVRIVPSFRGSYPETMVAAIAAFRAGTAPHIVQMFEVGTATMMAAGRAVIPVHELLERTGTRIDFSDFLPAVRGYYQTADGKQASMPFNSSTSVMFWNKDHFRQAGLDPEKPPTTYAELEAAMRRLKAANTGAVPFTTSWPTWLNIEQVSALHDIPLATLANGFAGLGAELRIDNPLIRRHLENLVRWQSEGLYRYGGRDNAADALLPAGQASIVLASSGLRARVEKEARFAWGEGMLPYYDDVPGAPINSIIGGASFWVMQGGPRNTRSEAEMRGIAEFFRHISQPAAQAKWHTDTGYLPLTRAAFEQVKASGFYERNPGAQVPIEQLLRGGRMTDNSRGIRLGGFVEIRVIMQEELERALQGQQPVAQALANATTRGNQVLRNFERQNRA